MNTAKRGKQITIYASMNSCRSDWQPVLKSISDALSLAGIEPGYRADPKYSNAIPNNCYLSYRNDYDPENPTMSRRPVPGNEGVCAPGVLDTLHGHIHAPTPGKEPKPLPVQQSSATGTAFDTITSRAFSTSRRTESDYGTSSSPTTSEELASKMKALRTVSSVNNDADMHSARSENDDSSSSETDDDSEKKHGPS